MNDDFRLSNYVIYKSSRRSGPSRVHLCVRKDLPSHQVHSSDSDFPEFVACKVSFGEQCITVINFYLQPSSRISVEELTNIFNISNSYTFVCGDFNAHNIIWGSDRCDARGNVVECAADKCNLTILNDGSPTFLRGHNYSSCIDVTMCSQDLVNGVGWTTDVETRGSDHFPILISHPYLRNDDIRRYSKLTNWKAFRYRLTNQNSELTTVESFTEFLQDNANKCTKKVPIPKDYAAVDGEYEQLRAIRRRSERAYRRSGSLEAYKNAQKIHSVMRRRLENLGKRRWRDFCGTLSPHTPVPRIWLVIRAFSGPVSQSFPFRALAVALDKREVVVADEFCQLISRPAASQCALFDNSVALASQKINACYWAQHPQLDPVFTLSELQCAIASCRQKSASGPDGITYNMLKNLGPTGTTILLDIYNNLWMQEIVPESWKFARIIPILKPAKTPLSLESFRPISLTSCLCKVMEKMIDARLQWWCNRTGVFSNYLTGFRKQRCTMDAILDIVTYVEHEHACGSLTVAVFLDIKRAFDTVSHTHVLLSMLELGLSGRSLRWISKFLSGRKIFIQTSEGKSAEHDVRQGVPQGSVLSPFLFNCVMADLAKRLPSRLKYSLYADDVCIWASGTDVRLIQIALQDGINIINNFLKERGMVLSHAKTAVLPFTRKKLKNFNLNLEGEPLMTVTQHRFLGVILDRQLSWAPHIKKLENEVNMLVNILRRIAGTSWGGSVSSMLAVHNALIRQKVAYSAAVLHGLSRTSEERLQRLLARGLRVCLGVPRATSSSLVIAETRQAPFPVMRTIETCRHFFRLQTQHKDHPLALEILRRDKSNAHEEIQSNVHILPRNEIWSSEMDYPPWLLAIPSIEFSVDGIIRKRDMFIQAAQQLALYQIHMRYPGYIQVYTDGSSITTSSTSAFIIPQLNIQESFKLCRTTSSTTAELFAILYAIKFINSAADARKWVLFSDSQAALRSLSSTNTTVISDSMTYETLKELTKASKAQHEIKFQWIPGHCNIPGNTAADEAARQAHRKDVTISLPISKNELRGLIKATTFRMSKTAWFDQSTKSCDLYHIDPFIEFKITIALDRSMETLIHRLRLGTAYTKHFLHRIGRAETPECECGFIDEDVCHLLIDCPHHDTPRRRLKSELLALDHRPFSLRKLLGPWPTRVLQTHALKALTRFLQDSGIADKY